MHIDQDPCEYYSSPTSVLARYPSSVDVTGSATEGKFGGGAISVDDQGFISLENSNLSSATAHYVRGNFKIQSGGFPDGDPAILAFRNGGVFLGGLLRDGGTEEFFVIDANLANVGSGGAVLLDQNMTIEVRFFPGTGANGTIIVCVNETEIINLSGQDFDDGLGSDVLDEIRFASGTSPPAGSLFGFWDDLILWDESADGTDFVDNFLGDLHITVLRMTGDLVPEEWALSAGVDSFGLVDDATPGDDDGDSTNLTAVAAGDTTLTTMFDVQNPPVTVGNDILNVSVHSSLRTVVPGSLGEEDIGLILKSGVTTCNINVGETDTFPTSYTPTYIHFFDDPNTTAPWLRSAVCAVEAGVFYEHVDV